MNYIKIYSDLIRRSENRIIDGYTEKHHIIPVCLGGTNNKENIAILTAREHYVAHYLLCKIHPANSKLAKGLWFMSHQNTAGMLIRKYKVTSWAYEHARLRCSKAMKGYHHTEETRNKMTGNKHTTESNLLFAEVQKELIAKEKLLGIDRSDRINYAGSWWNNGITEIRCDSQPGIDWKNTRLDRKFKWWTNGITCTMSKNCPADGWREGRIYNRKKIYNIKNI